MLNDLRVGMRFLWRDKTFTFASAATLAICIAANVVLFTIVDHVVLRSLPWPHADRLVLMGNQYPGAGACCGTASGVPDYYDRLRETTIYDEQALYTWRTVTIDQDGSPSRVLTMDVTPSLFRVLSVSPALGRSFTDAEGEVGHEREVVLSYGLWQRVFGGDRDAVGRDLRINGQPYAIIGVMPRTFSFLDGNTPDRMTGLWRPLAFTTEQKSDARRHSNGWQHIARLKTGAAIRQAQEQIDALNARNLERFPEYRQLLINARFRTDVVRLQDSLVRDVKPTLYWLWGGALFVLLIGAVNVANLLLVRTSARLRELVTRIALGSGRWRIARQLVIENVLLTMISGALGVAIGFAVLRLLTVLNLLDLPRGTEIRIDAGVGVFAIAIAAVVGMALALVPLAHLLGVNMAAVLTEQGRSSTSSRSTRFLRRTFVVLQVAFAFVLLVGAGLLLASFQRVLAIDPGFTADHVLTASVALPQTRYPDDPSIRTFTTEALRQLRALPGVTSAGATDSIPFGGNHSDSVILAEGYQMQPGESVISPSDVVVTPGYFQTIGARVERGRFFDDRDGADAPKTIIVDERLARRLWPNQDPIGRRMYRPTNINNLLAVTDQLCDRRYHGRWSAARLARDAGVDEAAMRKRLQRIRDKLRKEIRPQLSDLPENPVGKTLELLRTVYADLAEVTLPEIVDFAEARKTIGDDALYIDPLELHHVDESRILRYDLTLPLLLMVRYEGRPLRIWTAGKAYRRCQIDATHLDAFHQAEVLCLDERGRLDPWRMTGKVLQSVDLLLPGRAVRIMPTQYAMCSQAWELGVEDDGRWFEVLAWGVFTDRIMRHLGGNPDLHTAVGVAMASSAWRCFVTGSTTFARSRRLASLRSGHTSGGQASDAAASAPADLVPDVSTAVDPKD